MVIIKKKRMTPSIAQFKIESKKSFPTVSKALTRKGKVIAFYDPLKKKVIVPKKPFMMAIIKKS